MNQIEKHTELLHFDIESKRKTENGDFSAQTLQFNLTFVTIPRYLLVCEL